MFFFPGSSSAGVRRVPLQGPRFGVSLTWVLTSPPPPVRSLSGSPPPGGFGSGPFRPWLASPGVSGVPSLFVRFAPFFLFLFCVLVRLTAGRSRVELGRLWVTIFGSSSIRFGLGASIESDLSSLGAPSKNRSVGLQPTAAQDSA